MSLINFQFDKLDDALVYTSSYEQLWVFVSILMAILSSYAALNASFQAQSQTQFSTKFLWILISAFTFGVGIWAMHFIGMLALNFACPVHYDLPVTLISIIPSILVSGLVLGGDWFGKNHLSHFINSLILSLGVGTMHYTGMAAMHMEADIRYNPEIFIISILVSIALAYLALSVKNTATRNNKGRNLWFATIMGCSVSVMHYLAIAATYFIKNPDNTLDTGSFNLESLAILVAVSTTFITLLCLTLASYSHNKKTKNQLKISQERLRFILESTGDCIWEWNLISDDVLFSNDWAKKLGFTQNSSYTKGQIWLNNIHPDDLDGVLLSVELCFSDEESLFSSEYRLRGEHDWLWVLSRGKILVRDKENKPLEMLGTLIDISERKKSANEIEYLASFDSLTGLPNRRLFLDRLKQSQIDLKRRHLSGALIFIDLDRFKNLNDRLGHHIGDLLLQEVSQRIKASVQDYDVAARLGGDEFVVMLTNLNKDEFQASEEAEYFSKNILTTINEKYILSEYDYHISASIGIHIFNGSEPNIENILKHADIAMYQSKKDGGNRICFFNPEMQKLINARLKLEEDLHIAVSEKQFELHYQAQFKNKLGILGAEVLLRWRHPERGLISPIEFIPVAEETGLILPIGYWILNTACDQIRQWQNNPSLQHLSLAINVSARQFHDANFVQWVNDAIHGDPAIGNKIKLELTESLLIENIDAIIEKMKALKNLGVQFSMDDFGTGYSSLSYLTKLPFDQLKIDQSFIRNIGINDLDNIIIKTIIGMGESLNMRVIAEGVETEQQLDFLLKHQCDYFQGFLFSQPIVLNAFENLVVSQHRPST